jgi:hypothetical protein
MKYIKMAEGVAGLFGKKVEVLFESAESKSLGSYKLDESLIPEVFNRPLIVEVGNLFWRIISARTLREKSIFYSRKVLLSVVEADKYKADSKYWVPTVAFPWPELDPEGEEVEDTIFLTNIEWRQFEFLPVELNTILQDELNAIEKILSPDITPEPLLGYSQVHTRTATGERNLMIPLHTFCSLLGSEVTASVMLNQKSVKNSFVVKTENHTYYGIQENGVIKELSLNDYESVDDEFMLVTSQFELVLADWCNAACIYIDLNATKESPITNQGDNTSIICRS